MFCSFISDSIVVQDQFIKCLCEIIDELQDKMDKVILLRFVVVHEPDVVLLDCRF